MSKVFGSLTLLPRKRKTVFQFWARVPWPAVLEPPAPCTCASCEFILTGSSFTDINLDGDLSGLFNLVLMPVGLSRTCLNAQGLDLLENVAHTDFKDAR